MVEGVDMRRVIRKTAPGSGSCSLPALALGATLMTFGAGPGAADARTRPPAGAEHEAKEMIVMIRGTLGGTETFGAGIIVGYRADRLYIATADHVVRKGADEVDDLEVQLHWLPGEPIEANLLEHVGDDLDLAVLNLAGLSERHLSLEGLRFDLLGDPEVLERGDSVYHVGNPNGVEWRSNVRPDAVSRVGGTEIRFESTFIAPGSSGGGLFDERWRLVGLVRADQPPDGVAVRIDRVLERLAEWGYPLDLVSDTESAAAGTEPETEGAAPGAVAEPHPCAGEPRPSVKLRAEPATLTWTALMQGFSDRGLGSAYWSDLGGVVVEPSAELVSSFEPFGDFVADCATGLMWHRGTFGPMTLELARGFVERLNRARRGGYSNWRIPTAEELASLTQPAGVRVPQLNVPLFLDPRFFDGRGYYVLSSDRLSEPGAEGSVVVITWAGGGLFGNMPPGQTYPVKPVRTIE